MTRSSPQVLPVSCREDPSSHKRLRTANPAGGSTLHEPKAPKVQALSRGTGIVCPAARRNQAIGNEKCIAG